jgi:sucrose phosphorylase
VTEESEPLVSGAGSDDGAGRLTRLESLLTGIYGPEQGGELCRSLAAITTEARRQVAAVPAAPAPGPDRWSERDAVLITYADSLRHGDEVPLVTLRRFLKQHLRGLVSTVHVLPFYPWSSDDGFAVVDYREVEPGVGDWSGIRNLATDFSLMADLVINHVSRESLWFIDFVSDRAPGRDFFRVVDPDTDLSRVVRPRNSPLLQPVHTYRGLRHVWATFSEDQIDLDFSRPQVLEEMVRVLCFYLANGVRVVRLDAIAYLWKEIGTRCIHHPHTHDIVRILRLVAELACDPKADPVVLITETNVPHEENIGYFGEGDEAHLVYQFPLPPLVLHALVTCDSGPLMQWGRSLAPPPAGCTFLNFTASHDGIGLRPAEGLLPEEEIEALVELVHGFGGFASMRALDDGSDRPYELNVSLFDALRGTREGEDALQVPRFLASQILMLSLQGIPALYLHSLLATPNDLDGVERTGRLRSINRRSWQLDELEPVLAGDGDRARVFSGLRALLALRAEEPAFSPDAPQEFLPFSDALVSLRRGTGRDAVLVLVNVTTGDRELDAAAREGLGIDGEVRDLISGEVFPAGIPVVLGPCRGLWLRQRSAA